MKPFVPVLIAVHLAAAPCGFTQDINRLLERYCKSCMLQLSNRILLTTGIESGGPTVESFVAVRSNGQFVVVPSDEPGKIAVFNSRGQPVGPFGKYGRGPGEFILPSRVSSGRGDTLYVVDEALQRLSVVDGAGAVVRTVRLPGKTFDVLLRGNQLIVQAGAPIAGSPQVQPMHVLEGERVVQSFGNEEDLFDHETRFVTGDREITPGPNGTLWAAHQHQYRIDEYDRNGERVRSFDRVVPWFRPYKSLTGTRVSRLNDLYRDSDGRLWVLIAVPNPAWRPPASKTREVPLMRVSELDRMWDSVLEIIDPGSGAVILSHRDDRYLRRFDNSGNILHWIEGSQREIMIEVWRPKLLSGKPR